MEQYEKPNMEIVVLGDDVIITSCNSECGLGGSSPIELPDLS